MARIRASKKKMGVKDPELQKEKREAKYKSKINKKPGQISDQEALPWKMRQILIAKEKAEEYERQREEGTLPPKKSDNGLLNSLKYIKQNGPGLLKGMDRPLRPVPVFQQQKGESVKAFVKRMGRTTKSMVKQRQYEEKYGIEFKVDPKTGQQIMVKPEQTEAEKIAFEQKKKRLAKRGIHLRNEEEKLQHKREYRKELKMRKKRSKLEESEALNFSDFQDRPDFGEIVHAPPQITFKARKAEKLVKQNKVGGLLLAKKFENDGGKKKKEFPDMSLAKKAKIEQERNRVIEAYRAIRTDKYAKVNAAREEKAEADAFFKK